MSDLLEFAAPVYDAAVNYWTSFEDRWQQWSRWSDTPALRLDLRALALTRVFLSLALFLDWGEVWGHRYYWFTDDGVCPAVQRQMGDNGVLNFNIFLAFESYSGVTMILFMTLVAVGCLAVGYRTRLSTVFLFLMSRSKQTRITSCLAYGGDQLETHLLFWCIFLPLNHCWSLDAWLERRRAGHASATMLLPDHSHSAVSSQGRAESDDVAKGSKAQAPSLQRFGAPLLAYLLAAHMAVVYIDTGFWKNGTDWERGLSVEKVLNIGHLANPLTGFIGRFLRLFPNLCWLLSIGTLYLERYGPWPFLVPSQAARLVTTLAFIGLHIGMHLCLQTGVFHYLSAAAWMSGFPTMAMDKVESFFPPEVLRIASATHMQHRPRKGLGLALHLLASGFCLVLYVESVGWNCEALGEKLCPWAKHVKPHEPVRKAMISAGINDRWTMFAPNVTFREHWIDVMGAVEIDGKIHRVPLWRNGAPDFSGQSEGLWDDSWPRPAEPVMAWETHRWCKIFEKDKVWDAHKVDWGKFLCKQWKKHGPKQRLAGAWTVKSFRRVDVEVSYGELRYQLASMSWCDTGGETIVRNLPKPDWLKKGYYGKAISWRERRQNLWHGTSSGSTMERSTAQEPFYASTPLLLLLPTAAFLLWLQRRRRSLGHAAKGLRPQTTAPAPAPA